MGTEVKDEVIVEKERKHHKKSKKHHKRASRDEIDELEGDKLEKALEQEVKELMQEKKNKRKRKHEQKIAKEQERLEKELNKAADEPIEEVVPIAEVIAVQKEASELKKAVVPHKDVVKSEALAQKLKQQEEEESRIKNYSAAQLEVYNKIKKQQEKPVSRRQEVDYEGSSCQVRELINRMQDAVDQDRESNEKGKPALKRLMLAAEVYNTVKKVTLQEKFLENGGCRVLAEWLDQMPDGSFPNVNLVEGVLNCIDGLRIDVGHLEDSKLGSVLTCYSEGIAKMARVINLAKRIVEKWNRMIHNVKCNYDSEGDFDEEYKSVHKRLQKIRKGAAAPPDEIIGQSHFYTKQNAFDFVERPQPQEELARDKRRNPESGRARLERTLMALRKARTVK